VEKSKTTMTEADWQAFSKELEAPCKVLNEALEGDKVGVFKKIKIAAVMLRFTTIVGEAAMNTAVEEIGKKMEENHVADSVSVAVDAVQKQLNSAEMDSSMNELKKAAEILQKQLGK
jgi:hypothetical protein